MVMLSLRKVERYFPKLDILLWLHWHQWKLLVNTVANHCFFYAYRPGLGISKSAQSALEPFSPEKVPFYSDFSEFSSLIGHIGGSLKLEDWFGLQIDRNICIQLCIQTFLTCLYSLCTESKTLQNNIFAKKVKTLTGLGYHV